MQRAGCECSHLPACVTAVGACTDMDCVCYAQFVADGVFYAELNELLTRELAEHGYSGTSA